MHRVVLFTRARCHLCDVAREAILAQRDRFSFDFDEVDVEGDDDLELEYGIRVPVVEIDGDEAFEVTVDPAQLARLLGSEPDPSRS